jgi:hypothetical protein
VELPELEVDLAQDVNDALRGVRGVGHGNGQIVLNLVNGVVQSIDCSWRKHRKVAKRAC